MSDSTCSVEGCSRHLHARELCATHYTAWRRNRPDRVCEFPGCEKLESTRRLCRGHIAQAARGEQLRGLEPRSPRGTRPPCSVCGEPAEAKGLCSMHYQRMRTHGTVTPTRVRKTCDFEGCDRSNYSRGLCSGHAAQRGRGGELKPLGYWRDQTAKTYADRQLAERPRGDECWTDWAYGMSNHEYPRPYLHVPGKRKVLLARYVFFATRGYWPEWACHRCPLHPNKEDGQCWNPQHVYDGDAKTNGADRRGPKTWKSEA